MVAVIEQARVTRRGESQPPPPPQRPAADYPAAARFLWEYLHREASKGGAAETHNKRPGWLWEGTISGAVRFLWPGMGEAPTKNAITALSRALRLSGSVAVLTQGRNNVLSMLWVSDRYAPAPQPNKSRERALRTIVKEDRQLLDRLAAPAPVEAPQVVDEPTPAPQLVDEPPAPVEAPQVVDEPPAPVEAPQVVDEPTPAPQLVDEPPAPVDELAGGLTDRDLALIELQATLDGRELALVDRELALLHRQRDLLRREMFHTDREISDLVARRRRLAGE